MKRLPKQHLISAFAVLLLVSGLSAQEPYRYGTTSAEFLTVGVGSAGNAMGEAAVTMENDLSSLYWNPATLASLESSQTTFMYQPWLLDLNTSFVAVAIKLSPSSTMTVALTSIDYGEEEVTSLEMPDGTGELYSAGEYALALSYASRISEWFAFGATGKFINSSIWHMSASAVAVDLGVLITSQFLSVTGERSDGLKIGMSISNYGTRMRYDGMDLLSSIDILKDENGNYEDVPGEFLMNAWELPLIFRLGVSIKPLVTRTHVVTVAVDALHPNNNPESMNAGIQYQLRLPSVGSFYLRTGLKGIGLPDSKGNISDEDYSGLSLLLRRAFQFTEHHMGAGMELYMMGNRGLTIDYAVKPVTVFGKTQSYTLSFRF